VGVQPLRSAVGSAHYLRYRYSTDVPAQSEIVGAVRLWLSDAFPCFGVGCCADPDGHMILITVKTDIVMTIHCLDQYVRFGDEYYRYEDPTFFDELNAAVTRFATMDYSSC
jgi:hypothetical protein